MIRLRLLGILCVAAVLLFGVPPHSFAGPLDDPFLATSATSSLFYSEPCCTLIPNGGPDVAGSITTNGSDVAQSFSNPFSAGIGNFGPMGASATLSDLASANAAADYSDDWFCFGKCGEFSTGINVFLDINGTASNTTNSGFVDLEVDLQIGTGDLHFSYSQDLGQAQPDATATVDGKPIFVSLSQDPTTLDWSFSLSLDSSLTVCSAANVCPDNTAKICGNGCTLPTFTTDESVSLVVDGNGPPIFLDAFDPIGFGFSSDNPDTLIVNAAGFAAPLAVSVPEPGSWSILAGGLAGLGWRTRRRNRARV